MFVADTLYMLTASVYNKAYLMESARRKAEWRDAFHEASKLYGWKVIAWVVLHSHYHAIVRSPENAATLAKFVNSYHKFTARKWNAEDGSRGCQVWWNYWDTCIRSEKDYYNRLRYVFWNPVKHGIVEDPGQYSFSNYTEYLDQSQHTDFTGMDEANDVPEF